MWQVFSSFTAHNFQGVGMIGIFIILWGLMLVIAIVIKNRFLGLCCLLCKVAVFICAVSQKTCRQTDPSRSVNVTLVLELRMQMTASSIFTQHTAGESTLKHHSPPPPLSFPNTPTLTTLLCESVSGSNDEQLTCIKTFHLCPSRSRRASFSHKKATTLTWFIYHLCSFTVIFFLCVCVTFSPFRNKQTHPGFI